MRVLISQVIVGTALAIAVGTPSFTVRAEALSTTSAGLGMRNITYTKEVESTLETEESSKSAAKTESISDPVLCQRISTPSSLGVELGAGGCVQGGGYRTFAHTISAHLQLIYYPFASRTTIDDDAAIRLRRQFFGDLYVIGQGGFAKITHEQNQQTPLTVTTDVVEFGGGIGWSYRVFSKMAFGVEGTYLVGSFLSKATTGSTSMITATAAMTVFL